MSGTVCIARDLFTHDFFQKEPLTEREAWVWLIMEASWKPRRKRMGKAIVTANRGEVVASIRFMATAWNWSNSRVQRYLKRLQDEEMIQQKIDTGTTHLTICNYDKFQYGGEETDTEAIQKRYTSDTNYKKVISKEGKKKEYIGDFEVFWSAVPLKVGKAVAEKAYEKALKQTTHEKIMAAMQAYAATRVGQDHKYTKHPASWLNAGRWDDVAAPVPKKDPEPGDYRINKHTGKRQVYINHFDGWLNEL